MGYVPFVQTIPFRLLFGLPVLIAITLWYRLIVTKEEVQNQELEKELAVHQVNVAEQQEESPMEWIDRITVKDGSRIHLVKADELIYIQACGDYVMLITPTGEYLKEQTMKYFETHLSGYICSGASFYDCECYADFPGRAFWKRNLSVIIEEWSETSG